MISDIRFSGLLLQRDLHNPEGALYRVVLADDGARAKGNRLHNPVTDDLIGRNEIVVVCEKEMANGENDKVGKLLDRLHSDSSRPMPLEIRTAIKKLMGESQVKELAEAVQEKLESAASSENDGLELNIGNFERMMQIMESAIKASQRKVQDLLSDFRHVVDQAIGNCCRIPRAVDQEFLDTGRIELTFVNKKSKTRPDCQPERV